MYTLGKRPPLIFPRYCVGMRRQSVLTASQIDNSVRVAGKAAYPELSNFEQRMIAEIKLYWILYEQTSSVSDRQRTEVALDGWKQDWNSLFGTSRSFPRLSIRIIINGGLKWG